MTKSITSKKLRTDFPWVKKQAEKGVNFIIYYRSIPIFKLVPYEESLPIRAGEKPGHEEWKKFKDEIWRKIPEKERLNMKKNVKKNGKKAKKKVPDCYWEGWEKMITHTKDRKPFSAVDLIRKDREET